MSLDESRMPQKWVFYLGKTVILRNRRSRNRERCKKTTFKKRGYLSCNLEDFLKNGGATGHRHDATGHRELVFCLGQMRDFAESRKRNRKIDDACKVGNRTTSQTECPVLGVAPDFRGALRRRGFPVL